MSPDGVRVRRSTSGGVHYVTVSFVEGVRLERLVEHITGIDPRAVLDSVTEGATIEMRFRVDDPDQVETSGGLAGFVSGGMSNIPAAGLRPAW